MGTQKALVRLSIFAAIFGAGSMAFAQAKKYQRPKPAVTAPTAGAVAPAADAAKPAAASSKDEKLDISEIEQKYWAPKDTDFSVVQNRTYTKAGRFSASVMTGPIVNDPFNSGFNYNLSFNYYTSERVGYEFMYIKSDLTDSKAVDNFRELSGGPTIPDFNRPLDYYGFGFNFVPFYAKMSFMGTKIIYFDMQFTPHIGMSGWEQMADAGVNGKEETSFSYGLDVTQYFFFSKQFAVRVNLHNRWYEEENIGYADGSDQGTATTNVTNLLVGATFFF